MKNIIISIAYSLITVTASAQLSLGGGFSINMESNWNRAFNDNQLLLGSSALLIGGMEANYSLRTAFSAKYQLLAEYQLSKRFAWELQANLLSRFIKISERNTDMVTQTELSAQIPFLFKWAFLLKDEQPLLSLKVGASLDAMISPDSTIAFGSTAIVTNSLYPDTEFMESYICAAYYRRPISPALELGLELNYPLNKRLALRINPHLHLPLQKNMYLKAHRYYRIRENNITTSENLFIFEGKTISTYYFSINMSIVYRLWE